MHHRASNDERVAILMRTKDRPILLRRAFASILNQTHQNWLLLCVNDGGDVDETEAIFAEFAFADRAILIHRKQSTGMESASNVALAQAQGAFVAVHDDDDAWHADFLKRTVAFLSEPRNGAFAGVVTNHEVVRERLTEDGVVELSREKPHALDSRIPYHAILANNLFPPISLLARKSAIDFIGGFNEDMPVLGDWDFNIKLLQVGDIGFMTDVLSYYHQRPPSARPSAYNNTVVAEIALHEDITTKYRNQLMRRLLNDRPENAALIQYLSCRVERLEQMLSRPVEIPDYTIQRIATEVWFEHQRWSTLFKLQESWKSAAGKFGRLFRKPKPAHSFEPAKLRDL